MSRSKDRVYVVSHPHDIRGIYATWSECEALIRDRRALYQGVTDRRQLRPSWREESFCQPVYMRSRMATMKVGWE